MNQPPHSIRPPDWRRPRGVALGTWKYVHERSIADHYDAFVADTPLCSLDERFVFAHLPPTQSSPQTILDCGCGTGRLAIPLAARGGSRVVGIDLSHRMLERMLAKASELCLADGSELDWQSNLMAVQANLVELDCLATDSADHAICMFSTLGMVQGRSNRVEFLRHAARAVRPGGRLILHVHRRWAALRESRGLRRLFSSWLASVRRKDHEFGDATYAYRGLENMFMHRFTAREIRSELRSGGWRVRQIELVDLSGREITKSAWNASGFFVVATN